MGGTKKMTDIVLDVQLRSEAEDVRLAEALDSFVAMQAASPAAESFDLDLMVRTVFGPGGERLKQIVFQHHDLAQSFDTFWATFRGLS
jgi:hypothetical protein